MYVLYPGGIYNYVLLQRDNFSRLLDKLMTSLKLDLQQYRVRTISLFCTLETTYVIFL